jgi:hypothetical protein
MRSALIAGAVAVGVLAATPPAFAANEVTLLSRTASGAAAGGDSGGVAISGDSRRASVAAFDSTSSQLTGGTAPGVRNVFTVDRAGPFDDTGSAWRAGAVHLVSSGLGGAPANGDSFGAALDGTTRIAPRCVAFVSSASNLVPGDTNGVADAFVRDLRTGRIRRVSVTSGGRQANGPTTAVAIDGSCREVAFAATAPNLALTHTRKPSWRSAVTRAPAPGTQQIYLHFLGGTRKVDRAVRGLTFVLSATNGRPGGASSGEPSVANNGSAVAFSSGGQVLERTLRRALGRVIHHHRVQFWRLGTRRIASGGARSPAVNVDNTEVAFARGSQILVAKPGGSERDVAGSATGPPALTDGGTFVAFASDPAPTLAILSPFSTHQLADASGAAGRMAFSAFGNYLAFARGGDAFLLHIGAE